MQRTLDDYEQYCKDQLYLQPSTLLRPTTALAIFLDFLHSKEARTLQQIQAADLSEFASCRDHLKPATVGGKQYDATDQENRLVADELERRWNQALQRVREVELRIEQHIHRHGKVTTAPTREQFEDLATELEAVWSCSVTDVRLKKRILRTLLHEIVVDVEGLLEFL